MISYLFYNVSLMSSEVDVNIVILNEPLVAGRVLIVCVKISSLSFLSDVFMKLSYDKISINSVPSYVVP